MSHPQPTDLRRAWSRRPWGRLVAAFAVTAACVAFVATPSSASGSGQPARRVVIVLATDVDWTRLASSDLPTLNRLLETGTLANVVARRQLGEGTRIAVPSEAALTLSAGSWTAPATGAQAALDASETLDGRSAGAAYETIYGASPGLAQVLYIGHEAAQHAQDSASLGARLGALASSFEVSGSGVTCVGNADWGDARTRHLERPAGVAAADEGALVQLGTVGESLLTSDASAPYGIRTDDAAFRGAYAAASAATIADAGAGPTLVVLDVGDTFRVSRAERDAAVPNPSWARLASASLERTVALAARGLTPDDLLMVISVPTGGSARSPQGFGSVLLWGRQFGSQHGIATSDSTRRPGTVTLPDLSATAIDAAGLPMPAGFIGSPVQRMTAEGTLSQQLARLAAIDRTARAVLGVKYLVLTYYTAGLLSVVVLGLVATRLWGGRVRARSVGWRVLEALLLLVASVPLGSWLAFAIQRLPSSGSQVLADVALATAGVWLVALVVRLAAPPRFAFAAVALGTAAVIAADQWLGAPLSFSAPLGYSPLEAARFYGLGNEPAALMMSAGLIGLALLCDELGETRGERLASWAVPVIGGVLVVTAILPMAGANIGVAVWGTFAVVVAWRLMSGGRLTWRLVVMALVIAALVAVSGVWIDSLGGAKTHVGKAISSAEESGVGALGTILVRKAEASAAYLRSTPWIIVFVFLYGWLLYGAFWPRGPFRAVGRDDPSFSAAMQAILLAGIVAMLSEDSGIVMPIALVDLTLTAFAYLVLVAASSVGGQGAEPQ